jgi:hypothetical protein
LVRRHDIGLRQRRTREEFRNAGADIQLTVIAHDRIAAPQGGGMVRAHLRHGVQHHRAQSRVAQIAGQYGVAMP